VAVAAEQKRILIIGCGFAGSVALHQYLVWRSRSLDR
jgi:hypothetical protein